MCRAQFCGARAVLRNPGTHASGMRKSKSLRCGGVALEMLVVREPLGDRGRHSVFSRTNRLSFESLPDRGNPRAEYGLWLRALSKCSSSAGLVR